MKTADQKSCRGLRCRVVVFTAIIFLAAIFGFLLKPNGLPSSALWTSVSMSSVGVKGQTENQQLELDPVSKKPPVSNYMSSAHDLNSTATEKLLSTLFKSPKSSKSLSKKDKLKLKKKYQDSRNGETVTEAATPENTIIISSWTKKYATRANEPWFGAGASHCKLEDGTNCVYEQEAYNKSDVVLFKASVLWNTTLPPIKLPSQKWVLFETESPAFYRMKTQNWTSYSGVFDYVASYVHDSNVSVPYGSCVERDSKPTSRTKVKNKKDYASGKNKQVAWFVSHCSTQSRRENYVKELGNYISVDVYGACGTHKCSRADKELCENLLRQKYKFYLAFENAFCREYITEKAYKCFQLDVVPIVYGGADYKDLLPPHSFIDVRDFESPKHLANYLHRLDQDDDLYNEYFAWKRTHRCRRFSKGAFPCKLCSFIKESRTRDAVVPLNLDRLFGLESNCKTPEEFRQTYHCW